MPDLNNRQTKKSFDRKIDLMYIEHSLNGEIQKKEIPDFRT